MVSSVVVACSYREGWPAALRTPATDAGCAAYLLQHRPHNLGGSVRIVVELACHARPVVAVGYSGGFADITSAPDDQPWLMTNLGLILVCHCNQHCCWCWASRGCVCLGFEHLKSQKSLIGSCCWCCCPVTWRSGRCPDGPHGCCDKAGGDGR